MKRQQIIYLILLSTISLCCKEEKRNEIKDDNSAIKIFFLDTNYIDVKQYGNFKDYADIELKNSNQDEFNFTTPSRR